MHSGMKQQREGILVKPYNRLSDVQTGLIDEMSRAILWDPGLLCYNKAAVDVFKQAGAVIEYEEQCVRLRIHSSIIDKILKTAPSKVVLGARNPDNRLILDAYEPRVRFGSGAESNVWLDVGFNRTTPRFVRKEGSVERLCRAAHLCENLDNLDFFIRCVNICDKQVTFDNKDVNKFLASLNNTTKHVQAGLTSPSALDDVVRLGEIIAGGKSEFQENPVLSFITCVIKSPLQLVDDTTSKLIAISKLRVPVVISSCPMGGATGPFNEFGMVAQINAELLAGIALNQLVSPGAPVLYGAVPVRTRLDNLNDMYGAPEFVHYNLDCAQMARFYGLPCYSTAGVADTSVPGVQAAVEKMMTFMTVPKGGAQYIHYAFGLLERTNMFCPEQAVMDNEHIGIAKRILHEPEITEQHSGPILTMIREVMETDHKTFMYYLPLPTRDDVYVRYPLEDDGDALLAAHKRYHAILKQPTCKLSQGIQQDILDKIPGVLPNTLT